MVNIFTLNARGSVMLPALRNYLAWSDSQTFHEIQALHREFLKILHAKGIDYYSLRNALTPQPTKHEAAFLFDEPGCAETYRHIRA